PTTPPRECADIPAPHAAAGRAYGDSRQCTPPEHIMPVPPPASLRIRSIAAPYAAPREAPPGAEGRSNFRLIPDRPYVRCLSGSSGLDLKPDQSRITERTSQTCPHGFCSVA